MCEVLLRYQHPVNVVDSRGENPFECVSLEKRKEIVELLLAYMTVDEVEMLIDSEDAKRHLRDRKNSKWIVTLFAKNQNTSIDQIILSYLLAFVINPNFTSLGFQGFAHFSFQEDNSLCIVGSLVDRLTSTSLLDVMDGLYWSTTPHRGLTLETAIMMTIQTSTT